MKSLLIIGSLIGTPLCALNPNVDIKNIVYSNNPLNAEYDFELVINEGATLYRSNYGYTLEMVLTDVSNANRYYYKLPSDFDNTKEYVFSAHGYIEDSVTTIASFYKNDTLVYDVDFGGSNGSNVPWGTYIISDYKKAQLSTKLTTWNLTQYMPFNNIVTFDSNNLYLDVDMALPPAPSGSEFLYYNILIIDIIEYNNYTDTYGAGYDNGYEQGKQDGATSNYLEGYDKGLQDGLRSQQGKIDSLNALIQDLQNQLRELQQSSMTPLADLIFTIADLPLRFFAQCFNFNFLGFNLAYVLFGALTILFIGFIINKIRNKEN